MSADVFRRRRDESAAVVAHQDGRIRRPPRPLIFESGASDSRCVTAPALDVPAVDMSSVLHGQLRVVPPRLPHVTEVEIARHYEALANANFGVDSGFYPLGSCTMKYNPRINEWASRLPGFATKTATALVQWLRVQKLAGSD